MQVKNERSGNCVQNGRKVPSSNPGWAANLLSDGMPCVYYSRVFGVGYVQSVTVPCSKLGLLGESLMVRSEYSDSIAASSLDD